MRFRDCLLADINNTSACLDFVRLAPQYGIRPILGIDFRKGITPLYIGIAKNNDGFEQLNHFLSKHLTQERLPLPTEAPVLDDTYIIYPISNIPLRPLHDHEYIGIKAHQLNKIILRSDLPVERLVVLHHGTFRHQKDYNLHKLLRAIDLNTIYTKVTPDDYADRNDAVISVEAFSDLFTTQKEMLYRWQGLLASCAISFDLDNPIPKNQQTYTGTIDGDRSLIRKLCTEGLSYRFPSPNKAVYDRIEKELDIIIQKGYVSYFLINWDITSYARRQGYFYVGRGSGANSIVAYLLRITDVDPIELDLYFERFINLYRENPPDFDIDFSWRDREDVTRYIFDTFPHTALLATYNTFQYRAACRELGKVFGLPKEELDLLTRGKIAYKELDHLSQLVLKYADMLHGIPSMLSVHAAGILISQKPIQRYSATFVPPKGFPTTQFDMVVAEDIGLYKFDILGQRGLAKIKEGLAIACKNNKSAREVDIHDIRAFKKDPAIKKLLMTGQAIGCFYVESPAMRMLLRKLKVDNYLGLVAASSIIRPGVAQSGMMHEYIKRERFPERRQDAHPVMLDLMPETYGIMVYQEDVIKVAHYFAGLTLGEADVLRRGMSGKYRSRAEFEKVQAKFFENCNQKGYAPTLSREVWRQIESFAGYAFAKGHSASYAVESYQALFLKAHYPLEYMVATVNNGGGFYRPEIYLHEARMCGGIIHPPCINRSRHGCHIIGREIYLGLGLIHSLETETIHLILQERTSNGSYKCLLSLAERTHISLDQVSFLIRINACRDFNISKKELLWKAHQLLNKSKKPKVLQARLFSPLIKKYKLPVLSHDEREEAFDQIELLGFPLCDPFLLLPPADETQLVVADLPKYTNKVVHILGYLVTAKDTKTKGGKRMSFGNFLDRHGKFLDTVHFPLAAAKFPFRGRGIYKVCGKVVEELGYYTIEVISQEKLAYITDPRYDFDGS